MMPVILFNKNKDYDASWCDEIVSIMRPFVLGNPYPITPTQSRAVVIEKYAAHIFNEMKKPDSLVLLEIQRLTRIHLSGKTIALICCCEPLPCHGDIVKREIERCATRIKFC
jgi:hypothetical protein